MSTAGRSARATTPTRIWRRFGSALPNAGRVVHTRRWSMPKSRPANNSPRWRLCSYRTPTVIRRAQNRPAANPHPVTPNPGNANKRLEQQAREREVIMQRLTRRAVLAVAPITLALGGQLAAARPARAAKKYGPGVTDSEIKIGNTGPYSGPLSNASPIPISMAAYFKMINEQGGVNGRKITFISDDDAYSPPKTVEMTRKLVESDQVLFISGGVGTPTNSAIWHYMNQKKVPQLFPATGATKWDDPKGHPWTMGFFVSYQAEGRIYAAYILKNKPDAKIGVLYQNDDFGKDYLKGLEDGLGDKAAGLIKIKTSYETTDPTVDSQIIQMM